MTWTLANRNRLSLAGLLGAASRAAFLLEGPNFSLRNDPIAPNLGSKPSRLAQEPDAAFRNAKPSGSFFGSKKFHRDSQCTYRTTVKVGRQRYYFLDKNMPLTVYRYRYSIRRSPNVRR